MKKLRKLTMYLCLSLFLILTFSALLLASDEKKVESDTTGKRISQIKIGDKGIIIKTQEGKEIEGKPGKIILDEEGLIIAPEAEETTAAQVKIKMGGKEIATIELEHGDMVKFGKNVTVDEGERVNGDVVSIGGDVRVRGLVTGSAISIGGNVFISSTGIVETDAVSVGGDVIKEPGAIIKGQNVGLGFLPGKIWRINGGHYFFRGASFVFSIIKVLFFFFLGILVLALAPKNVVKIRDKIKENMWKSGLIGFLGEILILPLFILLLVTIIGIPVALLILPLAVLLGMLLGYTSVSLIVGESLKENTNLKPQTQMMTLALGILAVQFFSLFSSFLKIFWGFFSPLALILGIIGFLIVYVVFTIGFGGAIQTLLGTRPKEKPAPAAPEQPSPQS